METIKIKYFTDIDKISQKENSDWIDLRAAETVAISRGDLLYGNGNNRYC